MNKDQKRKPTWKEETFNSCTDIRSVIQSIQLGFALMYYRDQRGNGNHVQMIYKRNLSVRSGGQNLIPKYRQYMTSIVGKISSVHECNDSSQKVTSLSQAYQSERNNKNQS